MTLRSEAVVVQPHDHPNGLPLLPRVATLEAQRDIPTEARGLRILLQKVLAKDEVPNDSAESKLRIAVLESSGDERGFLKALERNYAGFRNSPGHAVVDDIFRCWTIQEAASDRTIQSRSSAHEANS